jgi:translation elongation factor EF-4
LASVAACAHLKHGFYCQRRQRRPHRTVKHLDTPSHATEYAQVKAQIQEVIGIDTSNALLCSAKTGEGIEAILEAIVRDIPPPPDNRDKPLRALIFDSFYDQYLGVVCQFRVMDGLITKRDTIQFMNTGKTAGVTDLYTRAPTRIDVDCLYAGEVGCVAGAIKAVQARTLFVWFPLLHASCIHALLRCSCTLCTEHEVRAS